MFWGVILEPGKRYAQEVESPFHLTNAALNVHGDGSKKSNPVSVMLEKEKSEYILCTLDHDKKFQKSLDLVFAEGEEITFFLKGDSAVHLTGYILPDDEFGDELEGMSDEESDLSDVPEAVPAPGDLKRKMEVNSTSNKKLKPGKEAAKVAASPIKADQKNKAEEKNKVEISAKKEKPGKDKTPAEKKVAADSDEDEDDDDFSSEDEGVKSKYESLMKMGKFDEMTFDSEDDDDDDLDDSMDDDDEDESSDEEGGKGDEEKIKGSQKQLKQALGKAGNTPKAQTPKGILKQPGSNKKPNQTPGQQNQQTPGQQNQQNKKSPNQNQNQNQNQKKQFTPKGQGQGQQNHNKSNDFGKKSPFNQNQKKFGKQNTPNSAPFKESEAEKGNKAVTLPGGLKYEDVVEGSGPVAKPGKIVHVRYVGKLASNNREFDRTGNKPFAFRLGAGEVIKGWDMGVSGMKVGGKRKLTIPAGLAYGKRAQGPIPANSTLQFEIELQATK